MDPALFKIGEVADMLATSIRTIRYYEEQSLVKPVRTAGGTRLYTRTQLDRLRAVLHLARSGFSIETIAGLCSTRESCATGDEGSRRVTEVLHGAQQRLDERIRALRELKKELRAAQEIVQGCRGCVNTPSTAGCPDCPVRRSLHDVNALNLIWDQEEAVPGS